MARYGSRGRSTGRRSSSRSYGGRSRSYGGGRSYASRGVRRKRSTSRSTGREVRIVIQHAPAPAAPAVDPTTGQLVGPAPKPRTARF